MIGALVGAGLAAAGGAVGWGRLGKVFLLPLIASPALSIVLTVPFYASLRGLRGKLGIYRQGCFCPREIREVVLPLSEGRLEQCRERYVGRIFGLQVQRLLNGFHFLSGGLVSFARGLNDTPKIVALLATSPSLPMSVNLLLVGLAMAVGGVLNGRRVAHTMSYRITGMS